MFIFKSASKNGPKCVGWCFTSWFEELRDYGF